MKDDFMKRAELLMVRIQRVQLQAEAAVADGDLDKVKLLQQELQVLVDGMYGLREEQLLAQLEREVRPGWWRRRLWREK